MPEQHPNNHASAPQAKPSAVKKGLSTFTKIMLALLVLLAVATAAFVFNAWQQLNRINQIDGQNASDASIEVLTPSGAPPTQNASGSIFIPQTTAAPASAVAASAAALPAAATPSKPTKPARAEQPTGETPVLPTNTGDNNTSNTQPAAAPPAPRKPKSNLDDLF